jgi:phage tail-like protein
VARGQQSDFLQIGRFHVVDVSFTIPPVLVPVFGFKGCTLPQITINMRNIVEGNYEYPRKVVQGAEVGNVMLEQGVSLINSDFWDWTRKAVVGRKPPKNLLIVQFQRRNAAGGGNVLDGATAFGNQIPGGFEFQNKVPGRAWILKQCRPAMYKPGTDFDGMSQEVSIAQLELAYEEFEEFSLGV